MVKVVDLSGDVAGGFASKLFAHGRARRRPAGVRRSEPAGSLPALAQAARRAPDSDDDARALVADADVVFTSFDRGRYDGAGERPALRPSPGACVEITTSTFGATGPYSRLAGRPARRLGGGRLPGDHRLAGPGAAHRPRAPLRLRRAATPRRSRPRPRCASVDARVGDATSTSASWSRCSTSTSRRSPDSRPGSSACAPGGTPRCTRSWSGRAASGYVSLGVVTDVEFDRLLIARSAATTWSPTNGSGIPRRDGSTATRSTPSSTGSSATATPTRSSTQLDACGVAVAKVAEVADLLANPQLARPGVLGSRSTATVRAWCRAIPCRARRWTASRNDARGPARAPRRLRSSRRHDRPLDGIVVVSTSPRSGPGPSATRPAGRPRGPGHLGRAPAVATRARRVGGSPPRW